MFILCVLLNPVQVKSTEHSQALWQGMSVWAAPWAMTNTSSFNGGPVPPDEGSSSSSPWLRTNTASRGQTGSEDTDGSWRLCSALQESRRSAPLWKAVWRAMVVPLVAILALVTSHKVRTFSLLPWFHPSYRTKKPLLVAVPWREVFLEETRSFSLEVLLCPCCQSTARSCPREGVSKGQRKPACASLPYHATAQRFPKTLNANPNLSLVGTISLLTFF